MGALRGFLVSTCLLVACTGQQRATDGTTDSELGGRVSDATAPSVDLVYGMAGTDSLQSVPRHRPITLGITIYNRSADDVTIEAFEVAESSGVAVEPLLIVGSPRGIGQIAGEPRYPPSSDWPAASERPYGPFGLPAGADSADWGVMVLMRLELLDENGYVKGYRVRGIQGGQPFEDFVDTFSAYCSELRRTLACYQFANEHAFHPLDPSTDPALGATPGSMGPIGE